MIDDDTLYAWIDGELPPEQAARVQAAVAADPALKQKVDAHRAMRNRLRAAFGAVMERPVPDSTVALIRRRQSAPVIDLAAARAARAAKSAAPRSAGGGRSWVALAAALVAGITGGYLLHRGESGLAVQRGGVMVASQALDKVLDTELAADGRTVDGIDVHLTFRDNGGTICRTFSAQGAAGVACREGRGWAVRALFGVEAAGQGTYRMASADPRVLAYVDEIIDGQPFEAAAERKARATGW